MKSINIFLLFMLLMTSCDLYSPLPIESNDENPKLVVNALLDGHATNKLRVHISQSQPLVSDTNKILLANLYLDDAVVLFFENDELIDTLIHSGEGYYQLTNEIIPTVNYTYRLEVFHDDFENVKTEAVLFPEEANVTTSIRTAVAHSNKDIIRFSIDDEAAVSNFYEMEAESKVDSVMENAYISFGDIIPDVACGLGVLIFPDYCFDGESFTNEFEITNTDVTKVIFTLHTVSESYYNSYQNQQGTTLDAFQQVFAEPSTYYSNVENGYGIFYARNTVQIEL
ncbi:MAG: DUF4249 domain-containing protein [Saprospiraceae bacterium]